jgi:hypothetical protein
MPRRRNHAIWVGLLLTVVGAVSYFLYFARVPALRDFPWVNLPLVVTGVLVSFLGVWRAVAPESGYRGRVLGPLGLGFSLLLAVAFHWYVFDLSYGLPGATNLVLTGDRAPEFTLVAQDGTRVSLRDFRGRKVVLTFYRGHW